MASRNNPNPLRSEWRSQLAHVCRDLGARRIKIAFAVGDGDWSYYDPANDPALQTSEATEPPQNLVLAVQTHEGHSNISSAAPDRLGQVTPSASSVESTEMASHKDDDIPKVKFLPKPEGWKGDPGNPNFKTLGTLSPPIMRKIEPAGPHFLAFARRVSQLNYFLCLCLQ